MGAAWVLFAKQRSKVEILNDINGNLTNLFRCLRDRPLELVEKLRWKLVSQEDFSAERETKVGSEVERAARFYWLLMVSFGGRMRRKPSFGYGVSKRSNYNLEALEQILEPVRKRLSQVYVFSEDFEKLIQRVDRTTTFFYCDPPYFLAKGCYEHEFDAEDHIRLANALKTLKGKFLLSYDDCDEIRKLYDWATIEPVTTSYSVSRKPEDRRKTRQELLIRNYDL